MVILNSSNRLSFHEAVFREQVVQCNNGLQINKLLVNDLVVDCRSEAEDEFLLINILRLGLYLKCPQPYQVPCQKGNSRCYNISEICTFRLNGLNILKSCRTGEHLQSCATFECNMMLKCPMYYCIPWSYVCDGKWDCPEEYDE